MAKQRQEMLFGIRATMEAIKSEKEIEKVLIKTGLAGPLFQELFDLIREKGVEYQFVPVEKLNSLDQHNNQGVVALIVPIPYQEIEEIVPELFAQGKTPLLLLLDEITDVRNFGAIARSAECAGVHAIVIPFKNSAKITPDSIKTSAGALYNIPVCRVQNLKTLARYLKKEGIRIIAATEKAEKVYTEGDFTLATAIVMGSEDVGIEDALLRLADEQVKIPIVGSIQSLNVSVAASLMVYEAVRQRS
ncbi:23S rRNA (guanosine(2251)-2'-O)-methyltransferase RlmB [Labilibaculum sp. A4]|uniref:23S rRNA (guanosine(2251)-2'-O)-methyltransferase RlmB n=1 Tax=Labilibaculum euxinus TaxID=2686357 RepID=UPI000F625457|nr:23S rRNA (guanosine(2251)-2'-O)-methyltransferase RlmB [Labilibaculum euxinus]MDQ1771288.1 23S rRNA (guanosine(2251)-2'-O)-methyltransferase RlmB [Labilibaculum euxinus]MWN77075.1 23S rRNA (guanosine(2251)-2'-O)-methyltransferase RlmB [Labilibaculum euxinus]